MASEKLEDATLEYDDSPEAKERVFRIALKWFKKLESFSGECLAQKDDTYVYAAEMLAEIAEEGFKFDHTYDE